MKMAKASKADLEMAMELSSAIDALTGHWPNMPAALCKNGEAGPAEAFDCDDDRQCGTVLRHLLAIAERASLFRVVWGAAVMLDPANKLVDPEADTIEHHPDRQAMEKVRQAVRDYHAALDNRAHGHVAMDTAMHKIEAAIGMPWVQGASLKPATGAHQS